MVAVYPFAWQFEVRLFAESLVTPLTLIVLLLALDRRASARRAALVGLVAGLMILVRPSALTRPDRWRDRHNPSRASGNST